MNFGLLRAVMAVLLFLYAVENIAGALQKVCENDSECDNNGVCAPETEGSSNKICIPACRAPNITDGQVNALYVRYGENFNVTCNDGYQLQGDELLLCYEDGTVQGTATCLRLLK